MQDFVRQFAILDESPCANNYFADLFHFVLVHRNLQLYNHVTVHLNKFLFNNQPDALIIKFITE